MRVVCVNNKGIEKNFTVGKTYDVLKEFYGDDGFYSLRNDRGYKASVDKVFFEAIEEDKPTGIPTFNGDLPQRIGQDGKVMTYIGGTARDATYGKNYYVEELGHDYDGRYKMTGDDGNIWYCLKDEFVDPSEYKEQKETGIKMDSGKLKPTLLLDDMPLAINEILKVLQFGAEKYSEGNWLKVPNGINRYRNAADRHRLAIYELDDESGMMHLAHEATSVLMLLELKLRDKRDGSKTGR